jgi:hypothetical protein
MLAQLNPPPEYLHTRIELFDKLYKTQQEFVAGLNLSFRDLNEEAFRYKAIG